MRIIALILILGLSGCGYHSRQNEMTGQVKKVVNQTPIICPDRVDADLSLGVIRNGVGSVSSQDMWLTVPDKQDQELLRKAAETGAIVKVFYDVARVVFCQNDHIVSHVELEK